MDAEKKDQVTGAEAKDQVTGAEKKDPIIVDGMPFYTLSSYEPVSVVVAVRDIGEEEVDNAVWGAVTSKGGTLASMLNNEWIHAEFPQAQDLQELREYYKTKLEDANESINEQRKVSECINALADRLEQNMLKTDVSIARRKMQDAFSDGLQRSNWTMDQFLELGDKTEEDVERWLETQSVVLAKQVAALSALGRERGITVTNEEIAEFLNQIAESSNIGVDDVVGQIKRQGRLEEVRVLVLNYKAIAVLVDEASITLDYDKPLNEFDPVYGYPSIKIF